MSRLHGAVAASLLQLLCGLPVWAQGQGQTPGTGQGQSNSGLLSCTAHDVQLAFGTINAFSTTPIDTSAALDISCVREGGPRTVQLSVGIGPGSHSNSVGQRWMSNPAGTDRLEYNIFRDVSMTSIWGHTPGVDTVIREFSIGNRQTVVTRFILFSRIFPRQDVYAGDYTDSLLMQVDY